MKKLFTSIVLLFCTFVLKAQMLEQVNFSTTSEVYDNYLTGINNSGCVTGYIINTTSSTKKGFIITANGKILYIEPSSLSVTKTTVESINDHNVALVTGETGTGNINIYRAYVNVAKGKIDSVVQCTNVVQPVSTPTDINNLRDISGGYSGTSDFLFVKHDSTIPNGSGNQPWVAQRYNNSYNTFCGGINDANKVSGYYIDGSAHCGFVYDNVAHTYNVLNTIGKRHIWDINNNNNIVGETFNTTNNVWVAFHANAVTGGYGSFTSLNTIFSSPTIQSVATGINDNGVIVGHFINPTTNKWVGFIYHKNLAEYRLPGFDYAQHTWTISNQEAVPTTCWTPAYTQGIDYMTSDPYSNIPGPVAEPAMLNAHQLAALVPSWDPTWKSFATEFDITHAGVSSSPAEKNYYKTIIKPKIFDKWMGFATSSYSGHCYGFALTSLLRCYYPGLLNSWYNIPGTTNLTTVANTNNDALFAIERALSKQIDKEVVSHVSDNPDEFFWQGLFRLKNNMLKTYQTADPMVMGAKIDNSNTGHALLPYKIRTPQLLPFVDADTVFMYDSNYPTDSNEYFLLNSASIKISANTIQGSSVPGYVVKGATFEQPGIRKFATKQYSLMKSTSNVEYDPLMIVGLYRGSDYDISSNGNAVASNSSGNYVNDPSLAQPIIRYNNDAPPSQHAVDTGMTLHITTGNYTENAMVWSQLNKSRSMGLSRAAQLNETDHSTQKNSMISYGNPDNVTKYLNGFMREDDGMVLQQGVNIMVTNICAEQGDSIVTSSPNTFTYNVTKLNGTSNCTYHLTVYAAYNGEISEFHGDAVIEPNSSHTIDPYYVGNNGTQVAVIVDNGMDGNPDDTLFVIGWPVDLKTPIKDDKIRVYPNPVNDKLNIELASIHEMYEIELTDAVVRVVYTTIAKNGKLDIPMAQYPTGMYILQISDTKGHVLFLDKITKQ